jgi:hypothetical protein
MKKRKAEEKGEIYLILTIPEGFTLYELAESITDAFDFDFDHSFGFYDNIKSWTDSVERYESSTGGLTRSILFALLFPPGELEDKRNVARTKVNEVFDDPCKKLLFLYDYGDEWHFIVQLKETRAPEKDTKYPQIVESVGKAPPQYGDEEEEK